MATLALLKRDWTAVRSGERVADQIYIATKQHTIWVVPVAASAHYTL
jgi:hypothetical protein